MFLYNVSCVDEHVISLCLPKYAEDNQGLALLDHKTRTHQHNYPGRHIALIFLLIVCRQRHVKIGVNHASGFTMYIAETRGLGCFL